jgi:WD40 repeat protein
LWAAVYSPDGTLMAVGDFEGDVTILDAETSAIVSEDSGTTQGAAWDMEFSRDGRMLASCNGSGDIYFWDTKTWAPISELVKRDAHADSDPALSGCTDGVFSKGSDIYFSVGNNKILNAWDTTSGKLLKTMTFTSPIMIVSISGDGKQLGVALADGSFHILGAE